MIPSLIRLGHSPDPDDAFMWYALARNRIETRGFRFQHVIEDIEHLNRRAVAGELEVTALSIHAYAHVSARYVLLPHGASMGDGYGPLVVSRTPLSPQELPGKTVAIPGRLTSALLALRLFQPRVRTVEMPFHRIPEAVARGEAEAGLLIHEAQLTYPSLGLHRVVDLGAWWKQTTGLPLPLGGNAVRRDLGRETIARLSPVLKASIAYGLHHRAEALAYALQYARGLDRDTADRFVGLYVNRYTLDYGPEGREAIRVFLDRAFQAGLLPQRVAVEFADSRSPEPD